MVLGTSSDVLGEGMEEDADYLGALYNDEGPDNDHADFMAATGEIMQNPRVTSIFASPRGWRALRLPGARGAERRGLLNFMSQLIPFWKGDTIRDSPFATMVPARMWNDYINNMTATDDAVELAAPHSQAEEISLMLFCEEWANDPGHTAFRRRLMQHPMVTASDAVMKGNLIYSLAVGELRLRSVPPNAPNKLPYRLMLDILKSIPFDSYSYYELNNVHTDEGLQVYTDFLNRYTPLTATEVAMVEEMRAGVTGAGRGFASMTTNVNGDPVEAYALMRHTVEAYEVGDTMSVRANINSLMSPPYNYRSAAAQVNITGPAGGNFVSPSEIAYLRFTDNKGPQTGKSHPSHRDAKGEMHVMLRTYLRADGTRATWDGSKGSLGNESAQGYYIQMSQNGLFVQQVWENIITGGGDGGKVWRPVDENAYSRVVGGFVQAIATGRERGDSTDTRADRGDGPERGRRGVRGGSGGSRRNPGVKDNPSGRFGAGSTLGRGKYFYIQILPESRVEFKGKAKTGKGKRADSKQKKGGTRVTDPTGFGKVLPGSIGKGYYIKTGIHKRTGTEEPWLIALPREHFKTFTDSTKGGSKGLRTVKPFKASESVKKAWKKFTKYYGHPVFAGTEGNPNFFRIHRDHKGEYYDKLRSKPTKKE